MIRQGEIFRMATMHMNIALNYIYTHFKNNEVSKNSFQKIKGLQRRMDNCVLHHEMKIEKLNEKRSRKKMREDAKKRKRKLHYS